MDTTKKVDEKTEVIEVTIKPEKLTLGKRIRNGLQKHKKKIIGIALGAAGIAAGVAWNEYRKKVRAEEEQDEIARSELAEEWYQRGLDAGKSLPEPVEESEEPTEEA